MSNPDRRVTLLAHTVLTDEAYDVLEDSSVVGNWVSDADHLAEIAGRQSYNSWSRPNPKTAANRDYLARIIDQKHESVLAHSHWTFRFTDISRNLALELIRSRWWSFSQRSQRYVDEVDNDIVIPPLYADDYDPAAENEVRLAHRVAVESYERLVNRYIAQGVSRKSAREAARSVLPGGVQTELLASANSRAVRDFPKQRWSKHADAEIRELAGEVLAIVREYAPNTFQDIPETPYE